MSGTTPASTTDMSTSSPWNLHLRPLSTAFSLLALLLPASGCSDTPLAVSEGGSSGANSTSEANNTSDHEFSSLGVECIDNDDDGICQGGDAADCDDARADIGPGMLEICDGLDNNCDGAVDEGVTNACGECGGNCVAYSFKDAVLDGVRFEEGRGLVIPPADPNDIWVVSADGETIQRLDSGSALDQPIYTSPVKASGVVVDFGGNAWVLSASDNSVYRIQNIGCQNDDCIHPPIKLGGTPLGAVVDARNDIWVYTKTALWLIANRGERRHVQTVSVAKALNLDAFWTIAHVSPAIDGSLLISIKGSANDLQTIVTAFHPSSDPHLATFGSPIAACAEPRRILSTSDNSIWLACQDGLHRKHPWDLGFHIVMAGDFSSLEVNSGENLLAIASFDNEEAQALEIDRETLAAKTVAGIGEGCHWASMIGDAEGNTYLFARDWTPQFTQGACVEAQKITPSGDSYPITIKGIADMEDAQPGPMHFRINSGLMKVAASITTGAFGCEKQAKCAAFLDPSYHPDKVHRMAAYEKCYVQAMADVPGGKEVMRCETTLLTLNEIAGLPGKGGDVTMDVRVRSVTPLDLTQIGKLWKYNMNCSVVEIVNGLLGVGFWASKCGVKVNQSGWKLNTNTLAIADFTQERPLFMQGAFFAVDIDLSYVQDNKEDVVLPVDGTFIAFEDEEPFCGDGLVEGRYRSGKDTHFPSPNYISTKEQMDLEKMPIGTARVEYREGDQVLEICEEDFIGNGRCGALGLDHGCTAAKCLPYNCLVTATLGDCNAGSNALRWSTCVDSDLLNPVKTPSSKPLFAKLSSFAPGASSIAFDFRGPDFCGYEPELFIDGEHKDLVNIFPRGGALTPEGKYTSCAP